MNKLSVLIMLCVTVLVSVTAEADPLPTNSSDPGSASGNVNHTDISGTTLVENNSAQAVSRSREPNTSFFQQVLHQTSLRTSDGEVMAYPPDLDPNDYREKGYMYFSPLPRAGYVSAQTKYLLVRFVEISPYSLSNLSSFVTVTAQRSGSHAGRTRIASDKRTVIFEMTSTFASMELVSVKLNPVVSRDVGAQPEPYEYQFMTSSPMTTRRTAGVLSYAPESATLEQETLSPDSIDPNSQEPLWPESTTLAHDVVSLAATSGPAIMPNGVSVPSNFPRINITVNDNPDSGYIFLDNRTTGSSSFNVIFDNTGSPIWYWQTNDERRDMKVQRNGVLTMLARDGGYRFIGLDTNYNEIASYRAVNGFSTDEHELTVLESGNYFLIGLRTETVDMSLYVSGGSRSASVGQTVIQEFTTEGDLIFQWGAWDNFDVRDLELDDVRSNSLRFPHMNSIDIDDDGHILISSRHLSEITKIDRNTGDIIWRLGGAHSDFTFVNDPLNGFRSQHAARAVGNHRYILFDNGNLHRPPVSRAVEYELDLDKMTATLVWQYRETPDIYSYYMGNVQRLPNGNTLINWAIGPAPKLTEVCPDGTKAFEMNWVNGYEAYRVWRCPWQGMSALPVLQIENQPNGVVLLFNKFGDPNIAYYRIYAGTAPQPKRLLDVSPVALKYLANLQDGVRYYFRVTAVDINGIESGYSNEESVVVHSTTPGQNIALNGDFSQGRNSWIWETSGSASAQWSIENAVSHFDIINGGTAFSNVQLRQIGIPLIQGQTYTFEFDAWAEQSRFIEAKVGQDTSPWTNYSRIGYSDVTPVKRHFSYTFTMQEPSDYNSRVVFNSGVFSIDVYVDNVSLVEMPN